MKTVIDAVNLLEANLNCLGRGFRDGYETIIINKKTEQLVGSIGIKSDYEVCSIEEFNACVDELSVATWIDGVSIEEWKAGMKNTVIDSQGNELEIGKVYEFSDDGRKWVTSLLEGIVDDEYHYEASNAMWKLIRECQSPLGTIKKAPVKLVDGKAYQFESVVTGRIWVGFYNSAKDRFDESFGDGGSNCCVADVFDVKNIIPLAPEIK